MKCTQDETGEDKGGNKSYDEKEKAENWGGCLEYCEDYTDEEEEEEKEGIR